MERIDIYPTHEYNGYNIRRGKVYPFGASFVPGGINFSVYSSHATAVTLVLFEKNATHPMVEIPFPDEFRLGNVYSMIVFGLDHETTEYGFRVYGPYDPRVGHRFDPTNILLDPYARSIGGQDVWRGDVDHNRLYPHRAQIVYDDFDWEDDLPLEIPLEDLIIYEMHVRGFTQHPSSGVRYPGTFAGIREKIPYLKELGVNCVELMPIFEFDEFEHSRPNPLNPDEMLVNYWGYSTLGFFAPKAGYAATGALGMQMDELKTLVKELHRNGIEVMLDVVYNHTAEGGEGGPTISFRGLDNQIYYLLTDTGDYHNFSGTGNTLNCNHPVVRNMVLDSLRYWASEYHIDGFRFDLASILGRDQQGNPLPNPPLLEMLAHDPILAKCKLIAEAWDAGGMYQVGTFPAYGRWSEWNGKYRDDVRQFIKGTGNAHAMALRVQGSPDLYYERGPAASVNFITCHDGFTLRDVVSYNQKHNAANGENNRDGTNDNHSWNCGVEGETDDPEINALRIRQMKNFLAVLMISRGVPLLLMGDEMGRSKHGNNNTYCHDSPLTWLDWSLLRKNAEMFRFTRNLISFRRVHPVLRSREHFRHTDYVDSGYPDISWHGQRAWHPDSNDHTIAFMLDGHHARDGAIQDDMIYVVINAHWDGHWMELPRLPRTMRWRLSVNTALESPMDSFDPGHERYLENQDTFLIGPRSVAILVGR